MIMKSLKPILVLFFKIVLISYICIDPLYQYHFPIFVSTPVSVSFFCIVLYNNGYL